MLNAYIGPVMTRYLASLDRELKAHHYTQALQITHCGGGSISVDKAMDSPLLTLDSGPVSGVTGSVFFGKLIGVPNIITTDMGGTSFDVGIIAGGQPEYSFDLERHPVRLLPPEGRHPGDRLRRRQPGARERVLPNAYGRSR